MVDFRLTSYLKLASASYLPPIPLSPIVECRIMDQWDMPKKEDTDINIAKSCIYRAAGSGINENIFSSFSWI